MNDNMGRTGDVKGSVGNDGQQTSIDVDGESINVSYFYVTTKEICSTLSVAQSTVRTYSMELEKHGYIIARNESGKRLFSQKDVDMLRRVRKYVTDGKMTLRMATVSALGQDKPAVNGDRLDEMERSINDRLDRMESFNKELLAKLDEQQRENRELIRREIEDKDQLLLERLDRAEDKKGRNWFAKLLGR